MQCCGSAETGRLSEHAGPRDGELGWSPFDITSCSLTAYKGAVCTGRPAHPGGISAEGSVATHHSVGDRCTGRREMGYKVTLLVD